ncbi:hypothetical protein EG68_07700 [Paragonimus skrjabini miyazakii]|uniref:Cysteamine dioxygenase n=1 Tax=Paragonimus skrjabini miyazakii TaxID=59628 RepID=A0A8S9YX02_9TREM|nr:hypothetical protein EG68_07700 [Paragonimus skrjabini miyazakii]
MTTKIASVANLALHVFQQHSARATVAAAASMNSSSRSDGVCTGIPNSTPADRSPSSNATSTAPACNNTGVPDPLLQRLLTTVRSLTTRDIGFDLRWVSDASVYAAPVAYVHIMENEVFSMGIFVLRPGSRIPLHDHPGMYGVLRVVYGSLRCRSFSRLRNISANTNLGYPKSTYSKLSDSRWQLSDLIVARPHQDAILTPDSPTQLLAPDEGNLHEITPVDGPAVFLDILAPPYDHDLGTRECRFYKEVELPHPVPGVNVQSQTGIGAIVDSAALNESRSVGTDVPVFHGSDTYPPLIYLVETNQPKDYWCESAEYVGPSVI